MQLFEIIDNGAVLIYRGNSPPSPSEPHVFEVLVVVEAFDVRHERVAF